MKKIFQLFITLSSAMITFACSSTTLIKSTDSEAKIYVDDQLKGKGEYQYSDTKIVGSKTRIRLEKAGCEPKNFEFIRNEEFDVGPCIGGIFTLVPFLWIQKYHPEHFYEFQCDPKPVRKK